MRDGRKEKSRVPEPKQKSENTHQPESKVFTNPQTRKPASLVKSWHVEPEPRAEI